MGGQTKQIKKVQRKMKKVLFIATVVKTHINVFHLPYIKMFKEYGYETAVAAKNDCDGGEILSARVTLRHTKF